jgi:tetratricopeptide (TPR) repeat protein
MPAVCVVDGMPGSGKTALAVHAAHRALDEFPDGVLFPDLQAYAPGAAEVGSAEALDRLLRQLGVPGDDIPRAIEDRAVLYRGCLQQRRILVVIDNAHAVDQVVPLLPGEPGCRMLVTSRNRLVALDDAHHVSLGPLGDDEAVALFASVAGRMPDDTEGRARVATVVQRCGRLPLAVRIVAARYRNNATWTPEDLVERLADDESLFAELDDGTRSVYGALRLSYQDLPPEQRELLVLLTHYPSTDVDAYVAGAVADLPMPDARRLMERLQTTHLTEARAGGRFHSHDLVRSFAQGTGRTEIADDRHRAAVARLVDYALLAAGRADEWVAPGRYRPPTTYPHRPRTVREFEDAAAATAWFDAEWPALAGLVRVAAERGLHDRAWRLALLLRGYFFAAKLWAVWLETHEVALASARTIGDQWAEAATLNNLGIAYVDRGDIDTAERCYEAALPLYHALRDEHGQVTTRANLGWAHYYRGHLKPALRELTSAAEFYLRTGAERNAAITLRGIALVETELVRYADSLVHVTEALATCRRLGLLLDTAMALNCLGWTYFRAGRHDQAAVTYRQAVEAGEQANSPYEMARAVTGLGNIAAAADDEAEAQRWWNLAEERYPDLNAVIVGESKARHAGVH